MAGQQDVSIWMRPEHAIVGRPPERSRAEITAAAMTLADAEGLVAVSMRRVAAALDTGAASLYRYVSTRDDLLDLMEDFAATEYVLRAPSGDWLADLLDVARQARGIMRRHPWLPSLVIARPALGPRGVDLLEHVLDVLADHPAGGGAKLEAFALMNGLTAMFVQNEISAGSPRPGDAAYLHHVAAAGRHPRLAALIAGGAGSAAEPQDRFEAILGRALSGVLA